MVALIQSKNHASNKGKTAGRYQFDTHPTGIGLNYVKYCLDLLQFNFNHKTRNVCNLNPDINPIAKYLYGIMLKVELTLSNILDMPLS